MQKFSVILTADLIPSPLNPRKEISAEALDSLAASIKEQGIVEPLIVRPVEDGKFEIVCGERRFMAAKKIGLVGVPALVRSMTAEEAFGIMIVENLQREDLSEFEEAASFDSFLKRRADDAAAAADELAAKIGVPAKYIRNRAAVLTLPDKLRKPWEKGELTFAHMEQFLRLQGTRELDALAKEVIGDLKANRPLSVGDMKKWIANLAVPLALAKWDAKDVCGACKSNSQVQQGLFELEGKGMRCLRPSCFKKLLAIWYKENWEETEYRKKHKTNGLVFAEDVGYGSKVRAREFNNGAVEKCYDCPSFVTVRGLTGGRLVEEACIGREDCFFKVEDLARAKKKSKAKAAAVKPGEKPEADAPATERKVEWYGEFFRQDFFRKIAAAKMEGLGIRTAHVTKLALIMLVNGSRAARESVRLSIKGAGDYMPDSKYAEAIASMEDEVVYENFRSAILATLTVGEMKQGWDNGEIKPACRRVIFEKIFGVDLKRDWLPDETYFGKQTKAALVRFVVKHKLTKDNKFQEYAAAHFEGKDPGTLKKSELIEALTKSGIDLSGKAPADVLAASKD